MTDLFGLEQQNPRTNDHKEAAALVEIESTESASRRAIGARCCAVDGG